MHSYRFFLALALTLLLIALLAGGIVLAAADYEISRYVIGAGGGPARAGDCTLDGTLGQPVVGWSTTAAYDLCAGFWCGLGRYKVYLPLVLRRP